MYQYSYIKCFIKLKFDLVKYTEHVLLYLYVIENKWIYMYMILCYTYDSLQIANLFNFYIYIHYFKTACTSIWINVYVFFIYFILFYIHWCPKVCLHINNLHQLLHVSDCVYMIMSKSICQRMIMNYRETCLISSHKLSHISSTV